MQFKNEINESRITRNNNLLLKFMIFILCVFLPDLAFPTGACCVIGKGNANKFALSLSASMAKNHENINDEIYDLSQYAFLLKLNYPVIKNITFQVQAGFPISTSLENQNKESFRGKSGWNIGISAGYLLPEVVNDFELFLAAGYAVTKSFLNKEKGREFVNKEMKVSEFQAVLIGEYKVINDLFLFTGFRIYGSKIELKEELNSKSGSHLGSLGYFFGLRYSMSEKFDLALESSFGHTNLGGIGLIFYL